MNKICPECKQAIYGRADKKFCSDMCRNAFNNKQNASNTNLIRNINHQLKRNRRILEIICKNDKAKTTRKTLLDKGFDFHFITSTRTTQKGSVYYFVYDFGYLELGNDFYLVVKDYRGREEEQDS